MPLPSTPAPPRLPTAPASPHANAPQFFKWAARIAKASPSIQLTALPLGLEAIKFISGVSAAEFFDTWGLSVWIVFVPATATVVAHAKVVVFGYSACHGNTKGDRWGARIKHYTMQLCVPTRAAPC